MLNNDERTRLAIAAEDTHHQMRTQGSKGWLTVVDYLWAEFARMTTPRPRHDDDLRDLGDHPPTNPDQGRADECATLRGTVSGLRAELAATLRRLEQEQERLAEVDRVRGTWVARSANQAQTIDSLRQQIAGQERYLVNLSTDLDREQEAHRQTMRDLEVAREAAEQYRRDAVDAALRLGRIRKALDD